MPGAQDDGGDHSLRGSGNQSEAEGSPASDCLFSPALTGKEKSAGLQSGALWRIAYGERGKSQPSNRKHIKNQNKVLTNEKKTDIVKTTKENGRKKQKERTDHREHNELPHKLRKRRYGPKKT